MWNSRQMRGRLPAPRKPYPEPKGFEGVRISLGTTGCTPEAVADRLSLPRYPWAGQDPAILAISGGAAGGAFAAGALVGLSRAGRRPDFGIVTGVSTGALIAPFAFLGQAWDDRLRDAYTGGHAARNLGLASLSPLRDAGLFRSDALEGLIGPFVDDRMVSAVAEQHRRGRRLLIGTTNLDSETRCIWDMGAIAARGGPGATQLFRDVLIASASLPGLFPPRRFACEEDGAEREEMHVDGGLAGPLFLMPEALLHWPRLRRRMQGGSIYVLMNAALDCRPRTTPVTMPSVLIRSFETMLRVSYRQALGVAVTFCAANKISISVASLPPEVNGEHENMLNFDTDSMRRTFMAAVEAAQAEDFWQRPVQQADPWREFLTFLQPAATDRCEREAPAI